jgi:hypothetical protein
MGYTPSKPLHKRTGWTGWTRWTTSFLSFAECNFASKRTFLFLSRVDQVDQVDQVFSEFCRMEFRKQKYVFISIKGGRPQSYWHKGNLENLWTGCRLWACGIETGEAAPGDGRPTERMTLWDEKSFLYRCSPFDLTELGDKLSSSMRVKSLGKFSHKHLSGHPNLF